MRRRIMKKLLTSLAIALSITTISGISGAQDMPPQQMQMKKSMMMNKMMKDNKNAMMEQGPNSGMSGKMMKGPQKMMPMMMNGCRMNPMMMSGMGAMMSGNMGMMGSDMSPMMGFDPEQSENGMKNYQKYQKFFNETRNERKQLNDMQFEYGEARWNQDTTIGELQKMRQKMNELRQEIYQKRPQ